MIRRAKTKGEGLVVTSHDDELKKRQISAQLWRVCGGASLRLKSAFPCSYSLNMEEIGKNCMFSFDCAVNAQMEPYLFEQSVPEGFSVNKHD